MFEGIINSLGMANLVLVIVGISLLLVILLLMSYFRTLVSISNFTYPNAKFRAHGNPFIKKEILEPLVESRNINEAISVVRDKGYEIPKESIEDINEIEGNLDKATVESMNMAYRTSPQATKPFVDAWLTRYDVKMVKKAVKAVSKGEKKQDIAEKLVPVKMIDEDIIDDIVSSRNMQELLTVLKETELGKILENREWEGNFFMMDVELDKFAYEKLRKAVAKVETEERSAFRYFFGKYSDIQNLKIIIRGIREDVDNETLKGALIPPGRELEEWKLENMIESKDVEEALVELEGTSYEDLRKESSQEGFFELERSLDRTLMQITSEMSSQYILTVGPTVKFLVSKEIESRNLKVLLRGLTEGFSPDMIKNMMILEGNT
ncbi:MAG: V-type ATPase subunit [Thermoplasmatota archaeon]